MVVSERYDRIGQQAGGENLGLGHLGLGPGSLEIGIGDHRDQAQGVRGQGLRQVDGHGFQARMVETRRVDRRRAQIRPVQHRLGVAVQRRGA